MRQAARDSHPGRAGRRPGHARLRRLRVMGVVTTIRYQPAGSGPLEFWVGRPDRMAVGTHLPVYYDPRAPRDGRLDPGSDERFGGGMFIALGLATFCLIGVGVLRHRRSHPTRFPPAQPDNPPPDQA